MKEGACFSSFRLCLEARERKRAFLLRGDDFFCFPFVYVETQYTYSFQVESRDLGGWWRKRAQAEETGFSSFPGLGIFTDDLSLALRKHQKKEKLAGWNKNKKEKNSGLVCVALSAFRQTLREHRQRPSPFLIPFERDITCCWGLDLANRWLWSSSSFASTLFKKRKCFE